MTSSCPHLPTCFCPINSSVFCSKLCDIIVCASHPEDLPHSFLEALQSAQHPHPSAALLSPGPRWLHLVMSKSQPSPHLPRPPGCQGPVPLPCSLSSLAAWMVPSVTTLHISFKYIHGSLQSRTLLGSRIIRAAASLLPIHTWCHLSVWKLPWQITANQVA